MTYEMIHLYTRLLIVLPQTEELADKALDISPYNALAYGALVFVLGAIGIILWREYRSLQQRHYNYVQETKGLMELVESKIDSVDGLRSDVRDLRGTIELMRKDIET